MQAVRLINVGCTDKEKKKKKKSPREELQKVTPFIISSLTFITMRRFKDVIIYLVLMINYGKSHSEINAD